MINSTMMNEKVLLLGIEKSPATIVVTDTFGNIVYVNEMFTKTTGYSKQEAMGKNPRILKSGKQNDEYYSNMWKIISSGNQWNGQFINKDKNGNEYIEKATVYPIFINHNIEYFMAIKEDITISEKNTVELAEKNAFIQTVLDNLPMGIALNEIDSGKTTYMNREFERVYGWSRNDMLDVFTFFKNIYPDEQYRNEILQRVTSDIESGDASRMHWEDCIITHKDGSQHVINAVNIPMSDQNIMVSTVIDMTDKKKAENDLIELNINKDKFFSIIAHDLRGPFQSIVGYVNLIRNTIQQDQNSKLYDYLTKLYINSKHVYSLLDNLLYWSRLQRHKMEYNPIPINLYEFINDIIKINDVSVLYKNLSLINDIDESVVVDVDENMFYSIIHNILSNAIKFTKDEKKITIYSTILNPHEVEIGIIDEGIGISEENIKKILSKKQNFTIAGTNKEMGTGLGLILVQEFLEYHNSELKIESKINEGSKFYFRLPILSS